MITVKLGDILVAKSSFEKLLKEELPFRSVINLKKLIDKVSSELELIENERISLLKEYGTDKGDGTIEVPKENIEKFNEKYIELLEVESEMAEVNKINADDLKDVKITLEDYSKLEKFIEQ